MEIVGSRSWLEYGKPLMYHSYYSLQADPFRLSPDHSFCLPHPSFAKARAYMQYALQREEGFVMITGAPGTGKTTLIDDLLAGTNEGEYFVARLVSVQLDAEDLLRLVAYAFSIPADGLSKSDLLHRLHLSFTNLYHRHRRPLLIVDEAQGLNWRALEELRLLSNMSMDGSPLLQIVLVGQEELTEMIVQPGLEQFNQRIVAACRMEPLRPTEFIAYIRHRLLVAGWQGNPSLEPGVFPALFEHSRGIPRRINHICSRLLLHGALESKAQLEKMDLDIVISELRGEHYLTDHGASNFGPGSMDPNDTMMLSTASLSKKDVATSSPATPSARGGTASTPVAPLLTQEQIVDEGLISMTQQPSSKLENERTIAGDFAAVDRCTAPLWGAVSAALLLLSITVVVSLSAPEYQLRRLAGQINWIEAGIFAARGQMSELTGGRWPIGGRVGTLASHPDVDAELLAMEPVVPEMALQKSAAAAVDGASTHAKMEPSSPSVVPKPD